MNIPKYEELRKNIKIDLEKSLSKSRFEHSIGVEYTAANLAMKYCVDKMEVCMLSGLLHDYTKNLSDEDQLKLAKSLDLYINPYEEKLPFLLHGKTAAEIVKNKYNIFDEEILDAIRYHTLARKDMTIVDKIIFVADYTEPNRDKAEDLSSIRKLSYEDIDLAVIAILESVLNYLQKSGKEIDPQTEELLEFYKNGGKKWA